MNVSAILASKGRSVVTIHRDATIEAVAGTLAEHKIGAVVVVNETGGIAGIISERDIVRVVAKDGASALARPAATAMTESVVTSGVNDTIDQVMESMTQGRFRHSPVVDENGTLVGIISIGDVVKNHIAEVELEASALKTYLVAG